MKNVNVFVDVDLTLVDANCQLLPGAIPALEKLKSAGCHLFLWSAAGLEYVQKVARLHSLEHLFEGYAAKPDIIIDDMPETTRAPFAYDIHNEISWEALAGKIISKHID